MRVALVVAGPYPALRGSQVLVGHLALGLHIGTAPIELVNRATYLCAQQVIPHLRPLFAEWDDEWWPKPLPETRRSEPGRHTAEVRAQAERSGEGEAA